MDDVYFVPRELDEKVHKRHFPACGAELTALTQVHADFTCSLGSYIERLRFLDTSFFCASAVPVFVHVPGTQTVVGETAHWCADAAMWTNFSLPPSMVLLIMGSLPNVNPSVVEQRVCFSWNCGVRVPRGPRDHRFSFSIGNTTFTSACMATGIFSSTSFARFYVEFTAQYSLCQVFAR